ncbi:MULTISPECIES: MarR family transcriptional regulator [unclassified Methanosarcina]|uniref:helix-turn-helix transcriptional regulator n=1 Tax=unclassified Methanosarcina TaxID=2644672 RepID=UPI0006158DCB|nr:MULTISPECIES: MarR family transcriptional regulator [unclassified Methanosarcina]AKB18025.1 hypothetical protein MSWHS_1162 [Methanosarcina sp. WWM596]AKB21363.1 hypothetical protein MSWH1_1092 [Methanosarcina sp. WH1]
MNLNVITICVAAAVLFAGPASADSTATIHGEVYGWDTFEPLENSVVEVNSTPVQSMVAKYGLYSFELEPGNYLIKASYYQNSTLIYSAEKTVKIIGEGSYVFDLLLLPVYSEELMDSSEEMVISENPVDKEINNPDADNARVGNVSITEPGEINGSTSSTGYYLFAALLISLLLAGGYTFQKHRSIENNKTENYKLEKSKLEKSKLEKSKLEKNRFSEEKAEHKTEKLSVPVSTPGFSAKVPDERIEPKTEQELPGEPIENQLSRESDFEVWEKEEKAEIKERHLIPEIESATLKQETEEDKETSPEEPARAPEPKPEPPVLKKNYPLPADLQEIMDIIRGQGGRITQKDLRSKLKYSEGKVSLMLADLERRELIEKFKRGRGNVVILRDERR